MKKLKTITKVLFLLSCLVPIAPPQLRANSLQNLIDMTPSGKEVLLEPGTYSGPVIITKPVVLDGKGRVTIDGQGKGSVVVIKADRVTIKNLNITNSGENHDTLDAGIKVMSSYNKIINNRIYDTLFGIDLNEAHNNIIEGNDISSKNFPLGLRGDGVRIFASHRNVFRHNKIHDSRDMVIWYSNDNIIENNQGWNNRYSLHFMYSGGNTVRHNSYHHNTVGIFLMYSRDITVEQNEVEHSLGGTGVGIGLKEADNMTIINNKIVYCTSGFFFDLSPFQPDRYNFIKANIVAYNIIGVDFNSTLARNIFKGNAFIDNLLTLKVRGKGVATQNVWEGNYYSDYQGFDRNGDGYGDFPYKNEVYFETLWMNNDWLLMFSGSPVFSLLNLIARLVPISKPLILMTDHKPVFSPKASVLFSQENLHYEPPKINFEEEEGEEEAPPWLVSQQSEGEPEKKKPVANIEKLKENPNFNRYFLEQ